MSHMMFAQASDERQAAESRLRIHVIRKVEQLMHRSAVAKLLGEIAVQERQRDGQPFRRIIARTIRSDGTRVCDSPLPVPLL